MTDVSTDVEIVRDGEPGAPLRETDARHLTEQIRSRLGDLKQLVLAAYEGQAHLSLGYTSWDAYLEGEIGIGRSYSYRLIDSARAERGLTEILGDAPVVHVPEYLTRGIDVTQAVDEVRTRVNGSDQDSSALLAMFRQVADELRRQPPLADESVADVDSRHMTNIDVTQVTDDDGHASWLWESTSGWNRGWARMVRTGDPRDVLAAWSEIQTRYRRHLRGEVLEGSTLSLARARASTHDPADWHGPVVRDETRGWIAPSGHFYAEETAACRKMLSKRLAVGLPTS